MFYFIVHTLLQKEISIILSCSIHDMQNLTENFEEVTKMVDVGRAIERPLISLHMVE